MAYDFDQIIDRKNTNSIKYNLAARGVTEGTLPMWVADMDFKSPPCVAEALGKITAHGVFGYTETDDAYFAAVRSWFTGRFGWSPEREWLVTTNGVVNAIYLAVRALTGPGDGVVIQQPVYHPFAESARRNGRKLLINELVYDNGRYIIDFEDFENKVRQAKLFILCSPHNPVGRVWTRPELRRMGEICIKYGVKIISDEIHQDFVYPGGRHSVFASLGEEFRDASIICTAPTKTFNLAGLPIANIFISNKETRDKFIKESADCGLGLISLAGSAACEAAYRSGAEWLDALLAYLGDNFNLLDDFLSANIPKIKFTKPDGTYLAWLDCNAFGLSAEELDNKLLNEARLWLTRGDHFGAGGAGFARMNLACPRSILEEALERLGRAFC